MEVAQELGVKILEVRSDSQVVALQIRGEYEARGEKKKQFNSTRVPREGNTRADSLARLGSETDE